MHRLIRNGRFLVGATTLALLGLVALLAPLVAPLSPTDQHLELRLQPPGYVSPTGDLHIAGTDQFGRDVFSRLIYGTRVPLTVGFLAAIVGAVIGLAGGLTAGYFGRHVDTFLSTLIDVQLSMPFMFVALAVVVLLGGSAVNLILVFALTSWGVTARVARASAISLRTTHFVEAAWLMGGSNLWILRRHILINAVPPTLVVASVQVAQFIIFESAFGFFGLGVGPPTPTWGNMLSDARNYLHEAWWLGLWPGVCISLAALAANLLGDGIRDLLDPRETRVIGREGQ